MYARLTKIVKDSSGREYVACINLGTEGCRIHNNVPDCAHCPFFGAILNQLYEFESIICDGTRDAPGDSLEEK